MNKGFTLIELLVVIAIIALTAVLIFPNYRIGEQELSLQIAASKLAQNLRKVQEMSVSAKEFQGEVPSGGYGIYFTLSDPTHYVLFADKDDGNDYDFGETVETIELDKNVTLRTLSPSGPLTVIFSPPDPTVYFYPDAATASITIEVGKLRSQTSQYTYDKWIIPLPGWWSPGASCDVSQDIVDCPDSFSAQPSDPSTVYDRFKLLFINWSYPYQKHENPTTAYVEKTVEVNKAGLIAIE